MLSILFLKFQFSCNVAGVSVANWHRRLGHPNPQVVQRFLNFGIIFNKNSDPFEKLNFDYDSCKLAKSKVLPFPTQGLRASHSFEIIHSNI